MDRKIAVVGLGYVGLPLAVAFGKKQSIIGFDIKAARIAELKAGRDSTNEVEPQDLKAARVEYTDDPARIKDADFVVVAVPTPINHSRRPDLTPLEKSSITVGRNLQKGAIVVYESTVYPGVTEEFCAPILERESGMKCGEDFFIGYSPERINPGDKVHTLEKIVKVVSGQTPEVLDIVASVYETVVEAGVHRAANIKTAEAAKVIENTQRDLNIALVNELSLIFDRIGIDTLDVLEAAGTKWNFLPFRPGLVGGHCIGVDPYYLTHKAEELGYNPQVILAGRRINDNMGKYVADQLLKNLIKSGVNPNGARVGLLGVTFKEDVPDMRNSKVVDIIAELEDYCCNVIIHDPMVTPEEAMEHGELVLDPESELKDLDAVVIAVGHKAFKDKGIDWLQGMTKDKAIIVDVKGLYCREDFPDNNLYWRL